MEPTATPAVSKGSKGPACIVVMGVSGTGKTTLGSTLSRTFALPYIEGDDLHPPANIAKMSAGIPLNDEDREPWLGTIRNKVVEEVRGQVKEQSGEEKLKGVVVTCSSLKKYYRDILRGHPAPAKPTQGKPAHTPPPEGLRDASPNTLAEAASSTASSLPPFTIPSLPSTTSTFAPASDTSTATPNDIPTYFIHITGPRSILYSRMESRPGHFMKASMLDSQLATLEDPMATGEEGVMEVSLEDSTEAQVQSVREGLRGWRVEV